MKPIRTTFIGPGTPPEWKSADADACCTCGRFSRLDPATAEQHITVVEHGGLAGSNGPHPSGEVVPHFARSHRSNAGWRAFVGVADLHHRIRGRVDIRAGYPVHPSHSHAVPHQVIRNSQYNFVAVRSE